MLYTNQSFITPIASGKDSYALVLGSRENGSLVTDCHINATGAEWGLKMPNNSFTVVKDTEVLGGKERALDIVRGMELKFERVYFGAAGQRPVTHSRYSFAKTCDIGIKGGFYNGTFNECQFTDMLLGDYSIYDHDRTLDPVQEITLRGCRNPAGGPIIIRCLNAAKPRLIDTEAVVLKVPDPIVELYFAYCRRFGDTRRPVAQ